MYCKLFASLYQGTLRGRSNEILVFTNLLAHTDREGRVDKHFKAIADETGLSLDEVKNAVEVLESPDPESRSKSNKGARLQRLDKHRAWGWQVVNYGKYREIRTEADRAEQNRLAQARFRERRKQGVSGQQSERVSNSKQSKPSVSACNTNKPMQKEKEREEADAEGEGEESKSTTSPAAAVANAPEEADAASALFKAWNELPKPFKPVRNMSSGRKTLLRARLREAFWVENWRAAIRKLPQCPYATGKGDSGWVADIDFFLRPDSVAKIIEGKYEDRRNGKRKDGTCPIRPEDLPKVYYPKGADH